MQQMPPQGFYPQEQGTIFIQEQKEFTVFTPTGGEWISGIYLFLGLVSWIFSWTFASEFELGMANLCTGFAWFLFFGAIVNAAHCVEKAIRNSD